MNEKHRQVREWLGSVFTDGRQPQYEIDDRPLEILHMLKCRCERREKDTKLLIQDLKQKTAEYAAEAARLGAILEQIGLQPTSLSQSGAVSLRTLTNTALELDTRSCSETSYLLGIRDLDKKLREVSAARHAEQKSYSVLLNKTKSATDKKNSLQSALQSLSEQVSHQNTELEKKAKQAGFLQNKVREYKRHTQHHQTQVEKSGFRSHLHHDELCQKYEELKNLEMELLPLKSKLKSYQNLPPNLDLSRLKIEETRHQLDFLEKELSKQLDVMHM